MQPKDQRHLQGLAEMLAAILPSSSAGLGQWLPDLSHRDDQDRAHLERLSDFLHNQQMQAERFYEPILRSVLAAFAGDPVLLTLATSMLWDQFCLITVGFEPYQHLLKCAKRVLPPQCQVTLLADRGFEHGHLMHWWQQQHCSWAIRVKSDLKVRLADGCRQPLEHLLPLPEQTYLLENVQV